MTVALEDLDSFYTAGVIRGSKTSRTYREDKLALINVSISLSIRHS